MSISTEQYTLEFRDEAIQERRAKPYLRAPTPKILFLNPCRFLLSVTRIAESFVREKSPLCPSCVHRETFSFIR